MPRIARVVGVGLPHHVTQRGNNRCQVFFDDDDRRFYLWTLAHYRQKYGVGIWAYCLMDNHVHFLAVPEREESLARCFAGTNLVYTQRFNRKQDRSGRLWQNRFFSCPVDTDEYLLPVLRYIETNPVRAGKVKQAWDYEWSSARYHVLGTPDVVVTEPVELIKTWAGSTDGSCSGRTRRNRNGYGWRRLPAGRWAAKASWPSLSLG